MDTLDPPVTPVQGPLSDVPMGEITVTASRLPPAQPDSGASAALAALEKNNPTAKTPEEKAAEDAAAKDLSGSLNKAAETQTAQAQDMERRAAEMEAMKAPRDLMPHIMQQTPFMLAITALGGALTKQSGLAMLGAVNGMMSGVNQGDEEGWNRAFQTYQTEYQKASERWKQQGEIYSMYDKAYENVINGKELALKHTLSVTNDEVAAREFNVDKQLRLIQIRTQQADAYNNTMERFEYHQEQARGRQLRNDAVKFAKQRTDELYKQLQNATSYAETLRRDPNADASKLQAAEAKMEKLQNEFEQSRSELTRTMLAAGNAIENAPPPPGAGAGRTYSNVDEVKDALSKNQITREQAVQIVRANGWGS